MGRNYIFIILIFPSLIFGQILFEDVANQVGADYGYGNSYLGGGISFQDFDQDGWDDITIASQEGQQTIFLRNNRGVFEKIDLGINDSYDTKQVLWVDYDNDGDRDFFATSLNGLNKLYENNGSLIFKDVTNGSGLPLENLDTFGAAFGDIDNDGDLDLILLQRDIDTKNQHNRLFRNDDGFFVDISSVAGIRLENDLSFCASFLDYDNDGWQDLYVANDKYTKANTLYHNNRDGTFSDVSEASGTGIAIDAMSTTIGDFNLDGFADIYVTNTTAGNYHLKNNGNGTFTNVAEEIGTSFKSIAWGASFLDADNDADLDLYVSGMLEGTEPDKLPSAFYQNTNQLFFIPNNAGFANDKRKSFSNAIGDFDNNGFADIAVMNDGDPIFLWRNRSNTNQNNWIKVYLQGTKSNYDAIGSKLQVSLGDEVQTKYLLCGEGYLGQNSSGILFGTKDYQEVNELKIIWPNGLVEVFNNLEVNQTYRLVEGSGELIVVDQEEATVTDGDISHDEVNEPNLNEGSEDQASEDSKEIVGVETLLYPIPVNRAEVINICSSQLHGILTARIYDTNGKLMVEQKIQPSINSLSVNKLSQGLYYLVLVDFFGKVSRNKILVK